jgi:hypothetical protein
MYRFIENDGPISRHKYYGNKVVQIEDSEELDKMIKHRNIVIYIKFQRLSLFGHVQRMPDTRTVKKIFKWNPLAKTSQGRPKTDGRITSNKIFVK